MSSEVQVRRILPRGLDKFDLDRLCLHTDIIFVVGKRGTGKTTLIRSILRHHRHRIDFLVVMSGSEKANRAYQHMMVPRVCIRHKFDATYLQEIYNEVASGKTRGKSGKAARVVFVFDDLAFGGNTFWGNETIRNIMFMGRHYQIGIMFAVQYIMHIPLECRSQYNYAFTMQDNAFDTLERLRKVFFSFIRKDDDFQTVLQYFTAQFGVLVSVGACNDPELTRCMNWFRAKQDTRLFLVGSAEYRLLYSPSQLVHYNEARRKRPHVRRAAFSPMGSQSGRATPESLSVR